MNIIVTGASSGIGYETVLKIAKSGKHKIIAIARNAPKLEKLKNENKTESEIFALPFDLQSIGDYAKLHQTIVEKTDKIDILINNAGYLVNKPFELTSQNEIFDMFQTNVFAAGELIRILINDFSENSHIVNISSMAGFQGSVKFPGLSWYSAAKAAIASLTECLANELKPKKISVNCLTIGAVQTDMLSAAFPGFEAPLKPAQMAEYISHFALTAHTFMNGRIIPVQLSTP